MEQYTEPIRYSIIEQKNKREIVMLRGSGCKWKRCSFCDYHLDASKDSASNFALNKDVLSHVTGIYHKLEVVNSGSFVDLDAATLNYIEEICLNRQISVLYFECHWMHRAETKDFRNRFAQKGITVKLKTGVETFDMDLRENHLNKGIGTNNPAEIANYFDEICLLFGISGQTTESMKNDIAIGLAYFERVCVNIMTTNSTSVKPDPIVIGQFKKDLYPEYVNNPRVDILMNNTDFGIGDDKNAK